VNQEMIDGWDGPVHPAANLFPLIEGDEFDALVASIAERGLQEPCWLNRDGVLLDGRNRIRACQKAGAKPTFREFTEDDEVGFIISLNVDRRHLSAGQRAMLALESEPLFAEQAKKAQADARPRP